MSSRRLSTVAAAALLLGGVAVLGLSACESSSSSTQLSVETTLKVEGMVCESCEGAITAKLTSMEGVHSAVLSHTEKTAIVSYDPGQTSTKELIAAIEKLGYKASE